MPPAKRWFGAWSHKPIRSSVDGRSLRRLIEAATTTRFHEVRERLYSLRTAGEPTEFEKPEGTPIPEVSESHPRRLGQYELLELIGRGGMGAVYRARHLKLNRIVAVKILSERLTRDAGAVARFEREMKAVGSLDHPHIIRATDAAEVDGVSFLVMEFVEGIDLATLIRVTGPLSIPDACEIIRQAARGLQHAHEQKQKLIHRDIKPSNLLLSCDGTVKILDLGLALLLADDAPADHLTSTNQVMGTIDYMAPEQADNSHTVDARADLYSLGATLFKLLTGVAPLDTHNCHTPLQKLSALIHKPRTKISDLRADLPPALADLVQSLLASNPAERPQTAKQLIEQLAPLSQPHRLSDLWQQFIAARDTGNIERPETQFPISSMQSDTGITPKESSQVTSDRNSVGWDSVPTGRDGVPTYRKRTAKRSRLLVAVSLLTIVTAIAAWSWNRFGPKGSKSEFAGSATDAPVILFDASTIKPSPSASGDSDSKTNSSTTKATANSEPPRPQPITWTPGPTENVPTGILPAPAAFPKLGRWQIESKAPRGQITDLKWSPDGRWFACASADKVVRVYRTDGTKLDFHAAFPTQGSPVELCWCPDSLRLAVGGHNTSQAFLWQVEQRLLLQTLTSDNLWWPHSISWSPDGSKLVISAHQHIACWSSEGEILWRRWIEKGGSSAKWNPTKPIIALGGNEAVQILDSETGVVRAEFAAHTSRISTLAWSPSGRYLASGSSGREQPGGDSSVRIWSVDGKQLAKMGDSSSGWGSNVTLLAWSRDEQFLAIGADQVQVRRFEADDARETASFVDVAIPHGHSYWRTITGLDWLPDGRLAYADYHDGPRIWSAATNTVEFLFPQYGQTRSLAWSAVSDRLVTCTNRGIIQHWTADGLFERSEATSQLTPNHPEFDVAWSPDEQWLAINPGSNGKIVVCRANGGPGSRATIIQLPRATARYLSWSPDSKTLAISSAAHSSAVFLWDRAANKLRSTGDKDLSAAWLGWDKASGHLIKATIDGRVHRVDAHSEQTLETSGAVTDIKAAAGITVSPNTAKFVTWQSGYKAQFSCVELTKPERTAWTRNELDGIAFAKWHPAERLLCGTDWRNRRLFTFDAATGEMLGVYGTNAVERAFWSADGNHLATFPLAHPSGLAVNVFHLWKTSPTGVALPEVVGVTLPVGLAASFTPGGKPISLTANAEEHLVWIIEKLDGSFEYQTRAEFEQRVAEKQETSRLPIQESPRPPIIDPQASIRGCMFYWPMNEGRGQTTDSIIFSGQQFAAGFAGMSGGPEWTTDSAPVTYDNPAALSFDGIDDSLDSGMFRHPDPTKTSLLKHSMTISFWLKTVERKKMSLGGLYSPTNRNIFFLELNHWESWSGIPVPAMTFGVTDKAATRRYLRGIPRNIDLCDGAWHHLVIAWDDKKASAGVAYVDGENVTLLAENGGTTGWPYDSGPLVAPFEFGVTKVVGDDGTVKREAPFKGLLDEFRIYHRVLTEDEIRQLAARRDDAKP